MIRDCQGDLFESGAEALVNPVNCVGVAGKGLALEFKKRWPGLNVLYERDCAAGDLKPGTIRAYGDPRQEVPPWLVVYFPTKRHWRDASRLDDVRAGLPTLRAYLNRWRVASVAIPALGCGLGGLDWADVRPLIVEALGGLDCDVMLYGPKEEVNV